MTVERELVDWAQVELDDFESNYKWGGCSCHISPPCGWCTHPGNPRNLAEADDAWKPTIDSMTDDAVHALARVIEASVRKHLQEMETHAVAYALVVEYTAINDKAYWEERIAAL